jgi:hypothetical protein
MALRGQFLCRRCTPPRCRGSPGRHTRSSRSRRERTMAGDVSAVAQRPSRLPVHCWRGRSRTACRSPSTRWRTTGWRPRRVPPCRGRLLLPHRPRRRQPTWWLPWPTTTGGLRNDGHGVGDDPNGMDDGCLRLGSSGRNDVDRADHGSPLRLHLHGLRVDVGRDRGVLRLLHRSRTRLLIVGLTDVAGYRCDARSLGCHRRLAVRLLRLRFRRRRAGGRPRGSGLLLRSCRRGGDLLVLGLGVLGVGVRRRVGPAGIGHRNAGTARYRRSDPQGLGQRSSPADERGG